MGVLEIMGEAALLIPCMSETVYRKQELWSPQLFLFHIVPRKCDLNVSNV